MAKIADAYSGSGKTLSDELLELTNPAPKSMSWRYMYTLAVSMDVRDILDAEMIQTDV